MKEQLPHQLRNIRKIRGLTLEEVSQALHGLVTKQAISKYERGLMYPSPIVLDALLRFYRIGKDSLEGHASIAISNLHFRSKNEISLELKQRIASDVVFWLSHYLSLEQLLNVTCDFYNPFSLSIETTFEYMERYANRLREEWKLGSDAIPSVCRMLELAGVRILEMDWDDEVDGLCGWVNRTIPFMVLRKQVKVERKRFTALHELAHLLFPSINLLSFNLRERLCHRFASALLLPENVVTAYIGTRRSQLLLSELSSLRSSYGISIAATVHRLKDLDIINDEYYNRIFDERIKPNIMEEGWGSYPFTDEAFRYQSLIQRALAENLISEKELDKHLNGLEGKIIQDMEIM